MLIIGRKVGESIFLGPDVEVKIMDLTPSRVKLGIIAPRQLSVARGEMKAAAENNRAAAQSGSATGLATLISQLGLSKSGNADR